MKNITVSVPDDVYQRARVVAAERGRSLSALVAEYLSKISEDEDEEARFARLEALQRKVQSEIKHFSASEHRLTREQLHDRAFMREEEERARALR
ncbi:MAG TPA: DUF6364 family protein [Tepidiformaceae bacterium]|nr:DUF6364 family protein [Tepidiformaceae bacterium]